MLSVNNVDINYGEIQVIYNMSFQVEKGEIYAIFGRNGAGKTTTLHSCVNLVNKKRGNIFFNNIDITHMQPHKICALGIGFTFQERCVFPMLTVREHFSLVDKDVFSTKKVNSICAEAVEIFPDLEPLMDRKASALSGGEAQMVKLAMVLVRKPLPKLLLFDEPSTGFSPGNISKFSDKLNELKGQTTIIIVEQAINYTIGITQRYAIMRDGVIIHESEVKDVQTEEKIVKQYIIG